MEAHVQNEAIKGKIDRLKMIFTLASPASKPQAKKKLVDFLYSVDE